MRLFEIICILLVVVGLCQAEDLIFFADDHYKSIGLVDLKASVSNPSLFPGQDTLNVNLANFGRLEELMPISSNGSQIDIMREMKEELKSVDALNIDATLDGAGSLSVTSGPQHIAILCAGDAAPLQFNISTENSQGGWYHLPMHVDYMRQVDVSVSNEMASPLYQSYNQSFDLRVFVDGDRGPLRLSAIRSDLSRGEWGTIILVLENYGREELENCSAQLLAAPPFHAGGPDVLLGDLKAGAMARASFRVYVDANASLEDYQSSCLIQSGEEYMELSIPLALTRSDSFPISLMLSILGGLMVALLAASLIMKRGAISRQRRGRRARMTEYFGQRR